MLDLVYFAWVLAQGTSILFQQLLFDWQAEQHQVRFLGFCHLPEIVTAPSVQVDGWRGNEFIGQVFPCWGGYNMQIGRRIQYCFLTLFPYTPRLSARCFWHLGSKPGHGGVFCKLSNFNPQLK